MARTNTKAASETATREALADTSSEELARSVAQELVASFASAAMSAKERVFEQARIAFAAHASGASDADIAHETTIALAATFPAYEREAARNTSVTKGGASVTRVAITQRRTAWSDTLEAGMEPTLEAVAAAFKLSSAGAKGLAEMRTQLIEDTKSQPKARREAFYVRQATLRFQELVAANKAKSTRGEKAATDAADAKAEAGEAVVLDTVADIILYVRAITARTWSEDDAAALAAAFATASEALGVSSDDE